MGKKTKDKKQYYKVGVYCTEEDLNCLELALTAEACGLIDITDISINGDRLTSREDVPKLESDIKKVSVNYSEESLKLILNKLFGFRDGWYETEIVPLQRNRFGGQIIENKKRYMGWERQDRDWVDSRMCSDEMRTAVIFGKNEEM